MPATVTILCSGFGLGFYIPGLLIERKLRRLGLPTDVEVFENVMTEEKRGRVDQSRKAYSESFSVALGSQKIPTDIRMDLDAEAVNQLLSRWKAENRRYFITLSGHWVHLLDTYRDMVQAPVHVDLLYVDSDLSPSWRQLRKIKPDYNMPYRDLRLYDTALPAVTYSVGIEAEPPLSFAKRNGRLVVHGGGWGIGTFREKAGDLECAGYALDIVLYDLNDYFEAPSRRYYRMDPDWRTWLRDKRGRHTFPPFSRFSGTEQPCYSTGMEHHRLFDVLREAAAVVSKPGAGALIDTLASATPLVMLAPFGAHEHSNAQLWKTLGFGIDYEEWREAGYPQEELERVHSNLLLHRERMIDYADDYYARVMQVHNVRGGV